MLSAPCTEPDEPVSGIRLPPRVFDGEACTGPRMEDARHRKPVIRQLCHSRPCQLVLLAPTPKRLVPERNDTVAERADRWPVGWDRVISEKAGDTVTNLIRHLNQDDVAQRWSISPRTLERWRWTGQRPRFLKLGGRVVYRLCDIEAYEAGANL